MTEGLRNLAGNYLRSSLMSFTKSPLSGAATGALSTAILQSSSATTVAAIGFVGAQIITFPAALGIIFGANIGTTITGWLVAIFGFKFKLGSLLLPIIFVGALLRLFTKGRLSQVGYTIAGFGLIFVGISSMQHSMEGLQSIISFNELQSDSLQSRLLLVGIGIVFTIITQSSSAGVATTLTALYGDLIVFEQAAALVIGMDIGTTATAVFATIGGSVNTKRTGFSHVIYNFITGLGALILISPYVIIWESLSGDQIISNAEIALVAFHTLFNTIGVLVALPFTSKFARLLINLFPEKDSIYTNRLDESLLSDPHLALNALQSTIKIQFLSLLSNINSILVDVKFGNMSDILELQTAIDKAQIYVDRIKLEQSKGKEWERLIEIIHSIDHMQRLVERTEEYEERSVFTTKTSFLSNECSILSESIKDIINYIQSNKWNEAYYRAQKTSSELHERVKPFRQSIMFKMGSGEISVELGSEYLNGIRWLRRTGKHIARITQHLGQAFSITGKDIENYSK